MPPQDARRRLSSRVVALGMLGSLSTALVACSTDDTTTATCVDGGQGASSGTDFGSTPAPTETASPSASDTPTDNFGDTPPDGGYTVVDDSYCDGSPVDDGSDGGAHHTRYFWYYGGRAYFAGGRRYISGGSEFAPSGGHIRTAGGRSLTRGGFGGHGGEGGHGGHAGS